MSFCCGSDMLLTVANLRNSDATILNVPVLFCLACDKVMIHPNVEFEYEMLKEYAQADRAREVDLQPYIVKHKQDFLYDPKNHAEYYQLDAILKEHLDRTLDLYSMAQSIDDTSWKEDIRDRLSILQEKSQRKRHHS
jgi:hypothetical protein